MTKTKIGDLQYWDLSNLKICYMSSNKESHDFYAEDEDFLDECIHEWEMGNIISLDLMFININ
jgi:hypothetical protein